MVIKQRAISSDEKLERRKVILNAAIELLAKGDYHDITIDSVARKAGLAKGTIFLYFKTKEELFLQLQIGEYKCWFEDVNRRLLTLSQQKDKGNIDAFVDNIIASVGAHPMMIRLTPILHIILERNIDYKTAFEFKHFLLDEIRATGRLIERCLPFLLENDGARFLLHLQVLLIGLVQLSRPSPIVKQVIEAEGMEVFQLNYEENLSDMLALLINGMKAFRKR
ncbi:MAG: TetR/AcrR family transcriptional regulator [Dissulfurispiraceae bacterium]